MDHIIQLIIRGDKWYNMGNEGRTCSVICGIPPSYKLATSRLFYWIARLRLRVLFLWWKILPKSERKPHWRCVEYYRRLFFLLTSRLILVLKSLRKLECTTWAHSTLLFHKKMTQMSHLTPLWCPRLDLNQHAVRHMLLRHTCIPISPLGHADII